MKLNELIYKIRYYLKRSPLFIDYVLLSIFIFFIGFSINAWTGYPKGDDAYWHLSNIQFIADNFPNISWYPYNFYGHEIFSIYPVFSYLIIAFIHMLTGIGLETLLKAGLLGSFVLLGCSIFRLSRLLNIPRLEGMVFSLLIFSTPAFWNWSTFGGAYLRSFALPFIFLSTYYAMDHIDSINEGKKTTLPLIKVIAVLSITAYIHPRLWLFTILMVVLMYLLSLDGLVCKIKTIASFIIPVSIIISYMIIHILTFESGSSFSFHNYTLNPISGLFNTSPTTNLTLNTSYAFLGLILILPLVALLLKHIKGETLIYTRSTLSLLIASFFFSLYHLLLGWFSMPRSFYLVSAYDSATFLALFLLLFILSSYSLFINNFVKKDIKLWDIKIALILLVILELSFTLPLINENFTSHTAPDDPSTVTYELNRFINQVHENAPDGYRIGITHRVFTRWINYVYPEFDITGGRTEPLQPNKLYQDWFTDRVFYRFDHARLEEMYIEDTPKILPEYGLLDEKSVSPVLWFLDWTGTSSIVIFPNIMLNWDTSEEYLDRPQIFDIESGNTKYGDLYHIQYNASTPIFVASDAPILGISTDSDVNDSLYRKTLMILSYLNINSRTIIPLKIDLNRISSNDLNKYNIILINNESYIKNNEKLSDYVKNGGTVLLEEEGKPGNFELNSNNGVNNTDNGEKGKIIFIGSIDDFVFARDYTPIINFVSLLDPAINADVEYLTDWTIGYTTENTSAELISQKGNNSTDLHYTVDTSLEHNQINIYSGTQMFPTDTQGVITFEMYSDNWRDLYGDVVIKNSNYHNGFLFYPFKLKSEIITHPNKGWRKFSIPMTGFMIKEDYNYLLKKFNIMEIAINQDTPYNSNNSTIRLKNVEFFCFNMVPGDHETTGEITQDGLSYKRVNPQRVTIVLQNQSKGILVKDSFDENWKAYLTNDNEKEEIPIYFAGPALMYIDIPDDELTTPINITLEYESKLFGYIEAVRQLLPVMKITFIFRFKALISLQFSKILDYQTASII